MVGFDYEASVSSVNEVMAFVMITDMAHKATDVMKACW